MTMSTSPLQVSRLIGTSCRLTWRAWGRCWRKLLSVGTSTQRLAVHYLTGFLRQNKFCIIAMMDGRLAPVSLVCYSSSLWMGDDKVMFLVDCGLLSHCRKVGVRAASVLLLICTFVCLSVASALLSAIGRLVCLVICHWLTGVPCCPPWADWCA